MFQSYFDKYEKICVLKSELLEDHIKNEKIIDDLTKEEEALQVEFFEFISKNKPELEALIKTLPFNLKEEAEFSIREFIYESIAYNDFKGWESFSLNEIKSIIQHQALSPQKELYEIDLIYDLIYLNKDFDKNHFKECYKILNPLLKSPILILKTMACETIANLHYDESYILTDSEKRDLQKLLTDASFDMRIKAYELLKEANLLPRDFKLNFLDMLRDKFWFVEIFFVSK